MSNKIKPYLDGDALYLPYNFAPVDDISWEEITKFTNIKIISLNIKNLSILSHDITKLVNLKKITISYPIIENQIIPEYIGELPNLCWLIIDDYMSSSNTVIIPEFIYTWNKQVLNFVINKQNITNFNYKPSPNVRVFIRGKPYSLDNNKNTYECDINEKEFKKYVFLDATDCFNNLLPFKSSSKSARF